jgi:transposase
MALRADSLEALAEDFWKWRAVHQPISGDDIPRIERPVDWEPDWSKESIAKQREDLAAFEKRWKEMDAAAWPIPKQVDYRLMGSALARVGWEL